MPASQHSHLAKLILAATLVLASLASQAQSPAPAACPALLDQRLPRLQDEALQDLCQFKGKVLLIVNTASYCGFTPQYEGLEKLYATYSARGFAVLGFPSNDFLFQEPKSNKEIAEFCFNTYGVKFPMFGKSSVTGKSANPVFAALTRQSGQAPKWNFHKYLVDREGRVVANFKSSIEPTNPQITSRIEQLLSAP